MKKNIPVPTQFLFISVLIAFSCSKEVAAPVFPPIADFTFQEDASNSLKIDFTNTSGVYGDYEHASWDFGDGSAASTVDSPSHTYAEAGTYNVVLTLSKGGLSDDKSKEVTVVAPEPVDEEPGDGEPGGEDPEGNLIAGGDMENEDIWTFYNGGFNEVTHYEFANGALTFTNGTGEAQSNILVWQAIEVEGGKEYKFSSRVSSATGGANAWIQVYFGTEVPEDGDDYTDNSYTGIVTYSGCGKEPFDGDIADLGCHDSPGTGAGGAVMFDEGGTVYFVIKSGSYDGNLGSGFTVHNVSLTPAE